MERLKSYGILAVLFLLSRVLVWAFGVRLDLQMLDVSWQLLDPRVLQFRLMESLYYLHAQPPLFNLLTALILKSPEALHSFLFHLFMVVCGVFIAIGTYEIFRSLLASPWALGVTGVLVVINSEFILYEHLYFYDYPLVALMILAAWLLLVAVARASHLAMAGFFLTLAVLALSRSLFHPAWYIVVTLAVLWADRLHWRRIAIYATLFLLPVLGWYAKNWFVFGEFTGSTWLGMSLHKTAQAKLSRDKIEDLVTIKKVSPLSLTGPFDILTEYPLHVPKPEGITAPALIEPYETSYSPNYNHYAYIPISKQLGKDALVLIEEHPEAYMNSLLTSWLLFFAPSQGFRFFDGNRGQVRFYERWYRRLVYLQPDWLMPVTATGRRLGEVSLLVLGAFVIAMFKGGWQLLRTWWRRRWTPEAVVAGFFWLTIAYIAVLGNAVEIGENFRFRILVEVPLLWLALWSVKDVIAKRPALLPDPESVEP